MSDEQAAPEAEPQKPEISMEDRMRAGLYGLLGVVLGGPPDREQLIQMAMMRTNESDLGKAMTEVGTVAAQTDPKAVEAEYKTLFGAMLKPVATAHVEDPAGYMTALEADNARLGITGAEGYDEPADHIAALCDTMAGLILSQNNAPLTPQDHKKFFVDHISPWAGDFFDKLTGKRTAKFYGGIGRLGKVMVETEIDLCRDDS